jgi:hypothetical protein
MSTRNHSWGKDGRCVGLKTLPPLCANCLEILVVLSSWYPKGLPKACSGKTLPSVKLFASKFSSYPVHKMCAGWRCVFLLFHILRQNWTDFNKISNYDLNYVSFPRVQTVDPYIYMILKSEFYQKQLILKQNLARCVKYIARLNKQLSFEYFWFKSLILSEVQTSCFIIFPERFIQNLVLKQYIFLFKINKIWGRRLWRTGRYTSIQTLPDLRNTFFPECSAHVELRTSCIWLYMCVFKYVRMYTKKGSPAEIQTSVHRKLIGRSMTAPPPVLSPNSILPTRSSHFPARKNSVFSWSYLTV